MPRLNPKWKIERTEVFPENKKSFFVHVVRDDVLPGGSKQRALIPLLRKRPEKEFVLVAANDGMAQVALSYAAKVVGKKATVFVAKRKKRATATIQAKKMGGNIKEISPGYLTVRTKRANDYVEMRNSKEPGSTYLLPLGLHDEMYETFFLKALRKSRPVPGPRAKRVWMAVGSGVLMRTLGKVWPRAKLMGLQVGKEANLREILGAKRAKNARLFIEDRYAFEKPTKILPPYPSMANYDAKLWDWILRYGQEGDIVWNVGTDQ